ncbi:hypothetical protein D3C76_1733090 [compost metagenome]
MRAAMSAGRLNSARSGGKMILSDINDTSMLAKSGFGPSKSSGVMYRKLVRSLTFTRGSLRSDQSSWL